MRRGVSDAGPSLWRHPQRCESPRKIEAHEQDLRAQDAPQHGTEGLLRKSRRRSEMTPEMIERLTALTKQVQGYIYPNDIEVHWSILIVVYPYLTGLVAGAFILASLVKVFNVKELQPTYKLALLTALAFLLISPLPLLLHLGHPERGYEVLLTPNPTSAMAMFGFVYAWYLMAVLLLEVWFAYRKDLILWARQEHGPIKWIHRALALFSNDVSPGALEFDRKAMKAVTIVGIPSAFLLHGYVGFIFGSIKANPWWSSVLMPIVFLFSAIVSGIAMVLLIYEVAILVRKEEPDMACLDKLATFLFIMMIIDFSLEVLDFIHRFYEAEESIGILSQLVTSRLFMSLIVLQVVLGTLLPMLSLGLITTAFASKSLVPTTGELRRMMYFGAALLIQVGIFCTRWNVVI